MKDSLHLDRLLPISDAIQKLDMSEMKLRALIKKGKIRAAILPSGEN